MRLSPAARTLAEQNVGLAFHRADRARRRLPAADPDDLRSAALVGLCQAADRFDASRGARFSTFAVPRIDGAIRDHVRSETGRRSGRASLRIECVSLDDVPPLPDPRDVWGPADARVDVEALLRLLPDRAARVLRHYYLDGLTQPEVGVFVGIRETRVSQVRTAALAALREVVA